MAGRKGAESDPAPFLSLKGLLRGVLPIGNYHRPGVTPGDTVFRHKNYRFGKTGIAQFLRDIPSVVSEDQNLPVLPYRITMVRWGKKVLHLPIGAKQSPLGGAFLVVQRDRENEDAIGSQYSQNFGESLGVIRNVLEYFSRGANIKTGIREGQSLHILAQDSVPVFP